MPRTNEKRKFLQLEHYKTYHDILNSIIKESIPSESTMYKMNGKVIEHKEEIIINGTKFCILKTKDVMYRLDSEYLPEHRDIKLRLKTEHFYKEYNIRRRRKVVYKTINIVNGKILINDVRKTFLNQNTEYTAQKEFKELKDSISRESNIYKEETRDAYNSIVADNEITSGIYIYGEKEKTLSFSLYGLKKEEVLMLAKTVKEIEDARKEKGDN